MDLMERRLEICLEMGSSRPMRDQERERELGLERSAFLSPGDYPLLRILDEELPKWEERSLS
jgi:hypothetical protein